MWVVMENMPCGSLADLIEAHDVCPMREREIAFATKQLLMVLFFPFFVICAVSIHSELHLDFQFSLFLFIFQGLNYIHSLHRVHRDIKRLSFLSLWTFLL